jgi:hypothetical protein
MRRGSEPVRSHAYNPGQVNAAQTDLPAFHERDGKIIAYHGRNDEAVSSMLSM